MIEVGDYATHFLQAPNNLLPQLVYSAQLPPPCWVLKMGNSGWVRAMVSSRPSQNKKRKGGQSRREKRYVIACVPNARYRRMSPY